MDDDARRLGGTAGTSGSMNTPAAHVPEHLAAWLAFVSSPAAPKHVMSALELDGYLTGVVVAPSFVPPSQWIAGLWSGEKPVFDDAEQIQSQIQSVLGTVTGLHNALSLRIEQQDSTFEPAPDIDERLDEAAAAIPRAILLLRKIADIRARRTSRPSPMRSTKVGRNDPCPCGSGKKFKRCCGTA